MAGVYNTGLTSLCPEFETKACMMLGLGKNSTDARIRERLCFGLNFNAVVCEEAVKLVYTAKPSLFLTLT